MKKMVAFSILIASFAWADDNMILSQGSKAMFAKENKTIQEGVMRDTAMQEANSLKNQAAAQSGSGGHSSSDVMIVDPNIVANDWVSAFDALSLKKLNSISFVLRDHSTLGEIDSVEAMPGGYLLLFTVKTVQGIKYRVVKTGDIISLESK